MELGNRCVRLCNHISTLTGIHCALIDITKKEFIINPTREGCALNGSDCDAFLTHLYGAYQAERWDGKYIYYCPRGLTFIAVAPMVGVTIEYCIIVGPIVLTNDDEDMFEDELGDGCFSGDVPRMNTAQARSLSEIASMASTCLDNEYLSPDVDSGIQAATLQMMYDYLENEESLNNPIEGEKYLQEYVRSGDKQAAQKLLNELLVISYNYSDNDLTLLKSRVRELLFLVSRAAIDGGADAAEILSLCYRYENEIDRLKNFEELNRWTTAMLYRFISLVFDFNDIKHQNIIFKANAYIKQHLSDKLTLEQMAGKVYVSKSYFCRVIKDEMGCTFTKYVNNLRIEKSKSLLRNTSMSLAEIAYAVGFGDQSYFTRIFKKSEGMSPSKYRSTR